LAFKWRQVSRGFFGFFERFDRFQNLVNVAGHFEATPFLIEQTIGTNQKVLRSMPLTFLPYMILFFTTPNM